MKIDLRILREEVDRWAYADIEIDDSALAVALDKEDFIARELVPYIYTILRLEPDA